MTARAILDADMRTIRQWLLGGVRWWLEEMRSLVPAQVRRGRSSDGLKLIYRDGALVPGEPRGSRAVSKPRQGTRVTIIVPAALCLSRVIIRPLLGDRDLRRVIAFEADTLLPIPAGAAIVAGRAAGAAGEAGKMRVEVAGIPADTAQAIAAAILAAGVVPARVELEETSGQSAPIDFAPAMREGGLLPQRRSATPLIWSLVAFLLCLNVAVAIWRDSARVAQYEELVQGQQPAISVARTIARRSEQDRRQILQTIALRRSHDPLAVMTSVGGALPNGAWLQRFIWDGATVRLVGYRPAKSDVATALRRSGRFAEVRTLADETQAAVAAGEPFDLSAKVIGQ
ncbi:PilN domain-containing protein [Sphingomonas sp. dw_22]|uniref:PilN domain-containing protein n=1 Tax=Sphingomonas sp. dw_22 TaxID=2721175 RepID=UPI001BD357B9|nr:PilN domain-containing protein [Sphingomonas sp. dw_22]